MVRSDLPPAEIRAEVNGMGLGRIDSLMTKLIFKLMLIPSAELFHSVAPRESSGGWVLFVSC